MGPGKELNINISTSTVVKTLVILACIWFLYFMRDLVVVMLTALVIAAAIEPMIRWFKRFKIGRTLAVLSIYISLAVAFAGLFYFFLPPLLADLSDVLGNLPNYLDTVSVWNPFKADINVPSPVVENFGLTQGFSFGDLISEFNNLFTSTSQGFVETASNLFGGLLSLILIVVLSFYLAVQEDGIGAFLRIVLPDRYENYVLDLWHRSETKIGLWLQGQLVLAVLIGVLVFLGLTILGIRNALLLAILAAILELIPVFGPILSAIPSTIIGFTDGGLAKGIAVVLFYLLIQQFENHLIYPQVVKKIVGIPPILVILALIAGFELAGVLGILLSVPVAAVLVELLNDIQRSKIARTKVAP